MSLNSETGPMLSSMADIWTKFQQQAVDNWQQLYGMAGSGLKAPDSGQMPQILAEQIQAIEHNAVRNGNEMLAWWFGRARDMQSVWSSWLEQQRHLTESWNTMISDADRPLRKINGGIYEGLLQQWQINLNKGLEIQDEWMRSLIRALDAPRSSAGHSARRRKPAGAATSATERVAVPQD